MSTGYWFYLLEGEDIAAVRVCNCITDADALVEAQLQASNIPPWRSGTDHAASACSPSSTRPYRRQLERVIPSGLGSNAIPVAPAYPFAHYTES